MFFTVEQHTGSGDTGQEAEWWTWTYYRGTPENPQEPICQSVDIFNSDAAARKHVAQTRKDFGGARFAKVQSV